MNPGDGRDNDCDGRYDEEVKDGKDNDGDGKIDEDLEKVNASCNLYIIHNVYKRRHIIRW